MPNAARLSFCLGALWLTSCVAPEVGGTYQLPEVDARQIRHLLVWRFDIPKPIIEISADDPTHAHALAGASGYVGAVSFLVRMEKKNGIWIISGKEPIIVTGI